MSKYRADVPTVIGNPARVIAQPRTRRWIYGIAVTAVPLLVAYGVIAESDAALWIGLAGAVLGAVWPFFAFPMFDTLNLFVIIAAVSIGLCFHALMYAGQPAIMAVPPNGADMGKRRAP